ncbi:MAG TPA: hypothetical protein VLG36_06190 [Candidatus Chromulinivoraceae bacterium]|jgi:hypothetical protein|nr:hypothetical protein [Candidatus Chromulinivoraceae bacterium]
MGKDKNISSPSALEQVHLSFEYDMSWKDAKKAIRVRTHKS